MEQIYEQFFFLKYAGSWSFSEAYSLPVGLRNWFVERLSRQLEEEKQAFDQAQSGGGAGSQVLTPHNQPSRPKVL